MGKCYIDKAEIGDRHSLVRALQMLMAEENEAAAHYSQIMAGVEDYQIKQMLEEIRKDELNHIGVLLKAVELADRQTAEDIVAGTHELV